MTGFTPRLTVLRKKIWGNLRSARATIFSRLVLRSVYEGGQVVKELGKMGVDMEMGLSR